jgi:hypothetical protein
MAFIHGFNSYFYVPTFDGFSQADLTLFADSLNVLHASLTSITPANSSRKIVDSVSFSPFYVVQNALAEASREKGIARYVKGVVMVKKKSLWGYQFDQDHPFIQAPLCLYKCLLSLVLLPQRSLPLFWPRPACHRSHWCLCWAAGLGGIAYHGRRQQALFGKRNHDGTPRPQVDTNFSLAKLPFFHPRV